MVVVPTSTDVRMAYQKSSLDWFFYALTALGIALCVLWRRRGDLQFAGEFPSWSLHRNDGNEFASSDVALVPDVWAPARPDHEDVDPTPTYLPSPLDVDERQSDLIIDTMPDNVPYPRDPGFDRPDDDDDQGPGQ
jgi:hypothetical protein